MQMKNKCMRIQSRFHEKLFNDQRFIPFILWLKHSKSSLVKENTTGCFNFVFKFVPSIAFGCLNCTKDTILLIITVLTLLKLNHFGCCLLNLCAWNDVFGFGHFLFYSFYSTPTCKSTDITQPRTVCKENVTVVILFVSNIFDTRSKGNCQYSIIWNVLSSHKYDGTLDLLSKDSVVKKLWCTWKTSCVVYIK